MTVFALNIVGDMSNIDVAPIQRVVAVLNQLQPDWLSSGSINLKLVDDAEIQALNKDYSGNDYPTDVLSFSYIEDGVEAVEGELGDMVISLETAQRQAADAGTTTADELATLVLHGILHVNGFDHAVAQDRDTLDRLQADILANAGVNYRDFKWVLND